MGGKLNRPAPEEGTVGVLFLRLMRHFEEEGTTTPIVDVFLENCVEHSDAGIVESILALLGQRTRKRVLQATANNLRERRLQYKQWENEATKERKKKRQLQLWQAFQNGREKHPAGSLPAEYPPDNRNTLKEREALLYLQQQWNKVAPEAREKMLQNIVAHIPPHTLQELAIHIATVHSLVGDSTPPSQQESPIATAATAAEGEKRRNEQDARGKEEREREDLAERYTATGKHSQHAVQYTQIDIAEEDESQQPTQLVGEATQRRSEEGKQKGKEEGQREKEVERMLEEERQIAEETMRREEQLTKEEQEQIAQHLQEEEEQEDTDLQHFYYNHMEDVLHGDTGRPGWRWGEDGKRVCEAWQEEPELTADRREEQAARQEEKAQKGQEEEPGKPEKDKEETRRVEEDPQEANDKEDEEGKEGNRQRRRKGGSDNDQGVHQ